MNAPELFRLGIFAPRGDSFVGLVLEDDDIRDLNQAAAHAGIEWAPTRSIVELLADWDANFDKLSKVAAHARGLAPKETGSVALANANPRPPLGINGRMLFAAANYSDHVRNIQKTFTPDMPKPAEGDHPLRPYMFGKMSEPTGAFDDIVIPGGMARIDWEAELMVAIGPSAQGISPRDAKDHIAGYMTTNDVSCRDLTWRLDRPNIRSDWLGGKSFDSFAPIGPYFTPRQFIHDHADLHIQLWVNGELKQDGNSGDMTFDIEAQIEYASTLLTLRPGDMIATGTPAGTGQERLEFLKPGDVVECEVELCGRQRNTVVATN